MDEFKPSITANHATPCLTRLVFVMWLYTQFNSVSHTPSPSLGSTSPRTPTQLSIIPIMVITLATRRCHATSSEGQRSTYTTNMHTIGTVHLTTVERFHATFSCLASILVYYS